MATLKPKVRERYWLYVQNAGSYAEKPIYGAGLKLSFLNLVLCLLCFQMNKLGLMRFAVLLFGLLFLSGVGSAQTIYSGSMTRANRNTANATVSPNLYGLSIQFWIGDKDLALMPKTLKVYLYRKRDRALMATLDAQLQTFNFTYTFGHLCNPDISTGVAQIYYSAEIELSSAAYNDTDGYYFVNEPIGNRVATNNHSSTKMVVYHWFAPAFLFGQPDGSGPGKTATSMTGNLTYNCQTTQSGAVFGTSAALPLTEQVKVSPNPILQVQVIPANPLADAPGGVLKEVAWQSLYSSTRPLPGGTWSSVSFPGNNAGAVGFRYTPSANVAAGTYSVAALYQQFLNGTKVAEGLTESTLVYTFCPTIPAPAMNLSQVGQPTVPASATLCPGQRLQINAGNGERRSRFRWYNGNNILTEEDSMLVVDAPGEYRVTITQNNICDEAKPATISIRASVAPMVSISADAVLGSGVRCQTTPVTVRAVVQPVGSSVQWQRNGITLTGATSQTLAARETGQYQALVTGPGGCTALSNPVSLTLSVVPNANIKPPAKLGICPGGLLTLYAETDLGYHYQWQRNGIPIATPPVGSVSANDEGTYTVLVTSVSGCTALSSGIELPFFQIITPTISGDVSLCAGATGRLTASPGTATGFSWVHNGQIVGTNVTITITEPGGYDLQLTDANGCQSRSVSALVQSVTALTIQIDNIPAICGPNSPSVRLRASASGGTFSGPGVVGDTFDPKQAGVGQHQILYRINNATATCLQAEARQVAVVRALPVLQLPRQITVLPNVPIILPGNSGLIYSYLWTPAQGLSNPTSATPTVTLTETTTFRLRLTDSFGCTNSDTIRVFVVRRVLAPNIFTPNNDGQNDTWELFGIREFPAVDVRIFDRWGSLVFWSVGYAQPFDGTQNGTHLPAGVYTYAISTEPDLPVQHGTLVLAR
jgi:gliding motility-associated-like protein